MSAGLIVSLSSLLVIAAAGPVTFTVVSHFKLILIMVGAVVIFKESMAYTRIAGILLALSGLIWYSALQLGARVPKKANPSSAAIGMGKDGITDDWKEGLIKSHIPRAMGQDGA